MPVVRDCIPPPAKALLVGRLEAKHGDELALNVQRLCGYLGYGYLSKTGVPG